MPTIIPPPPDSDRTPTSPSGLNPYAGELVEYEVPLRPDEVAMALTRIGEHFNSMSVESITFHWDGIKAKVTMKLGGQDDGG